MKTLLLVALMLAVALAGCAATDDDETEAAVVDANARYTVESVNVSGRRNVTLSDTLRGELNKFVGGKLDRPALEKLAGRLKNELHVADVSIKVSRGTRPDSVVVNFEVKRSYQQDFDVNVAKFLYDSKQGWTGEGNAATTVAGNTFSFGLLSDSDDLVERFAGLRGRFERKSLWTDRLRLRFEFDAFHDQWNRLTLDQASASEIYRNRLMFMPEATLVLAQPLEIGFGVSFARFQPLTPDGVSSSGTAAARTESSNAVVSTLRYHRRWGSAQDVQEQELNGEYSMRAATRVLDTDSAFTRQMVKAHYLFHRRRHRAEVGFLAGLLTGNAPLYERFVLGNSTTLRGWNKFDLDPLGGSHVVHGSVDYRFGFFHAFYDTGAVWDTPQERQQRQSVGTGFKAEAFQLAVAFPIRAGRAVPVFYAGLNF